MTIAPALVETLTPRDIRRGVAWFIVAACAAVACIAATTRLASAAGWYDAGLANSDPPLVLTRGDTLWLATWAVTTVLLAIASLRPRSAARYFARGALLSCLAAVPFSCAARPLPDTRYEDGFIAWVHEHVQLDAIRNWEAARPAVATLTPVPPAQWPAELASLRPDNVVELPGKKGVSLEWGRLAAWGTSRRLFIAPGPSVAPPSDDEFIHYAWRWVDNGAYAAFQGRS